MSVVGFCRLVLRACRPYRRLLSLVIIGVLVETALVTVVPLSFKYLIDEGITRGDRGVVVAVLVGLCVVVVVVAVVGFARDYHYARLLSAMLNGERLRMFTHLQQLSGDYYSRARVGDILARFSVDLGSIEHALSIAVPWAVQPMLQALLGTVLLFGLDWRLALLAMLVFPLAIVGPRLVAPRATEAGYRKKQDEAGALTSVQESVASQVVVKAFGLERQFLGRFRTDTDGLFTSSVRVGFLNSILERSAGVGILGVQVVVLGVGALLVFNGNLTLGSLVAFQALFVLLSTSLAYIAEFVPHLVQATGGQRRVQELLAEPLRVREADAAVPLPRLSREIAFREVTFGYDARRPTVRAVSFTIAAGANVAFVGASGSGKSTVVNLLARFFDVSAGSVEVDGTDVRHATVASLRSQLGIVFQDSLLFTATIRANVAMGRPAASDAEIVAAAIAAEIHDFVMTLPQGYDTVVGEGGRQLSGGQRQRLAIARALVRDPAVLVLDEATSALDPASEEGVQATIARQAGRRTVVAITHRLAQIVTADRIFVLDSGRLVEHGDHGELVARGGVYASLWQKQSGFSLPSHDLGRAGVAPERLRGIPVLAGLDDGLLAAVAPRFVAEHHALGQVVFRQGDYGDRFYVIARGSVTVSVDSATPVVLQDGDHFGEMAMLHDAPRNATVSTRADSVFLSLRREDLMELLERSPVTLARMTAGIEARRQTAVSGHEQAH